MSTNGSRLTIFGGNGYGKTARWPSTEASFRRLLRNLIDNNFNAVMFDKAALGANYPAFIRFVKESGLKWLVDVTDYMSADGYTYGSETRKVVQQTLQDAWGFHIFSQVSTADPPDVVTKHADKISLIAKGIHGDAPDKPTIATINHDSTNNAVATALAKDVDYIGTWTSSTYFDSRHAAVKAQQWRNILGKASKASNRHFYFKMTFRQGETGFLNRVGNYLVAKSIADYPNEFAGTFWTTYQNEDIFGYATTPESEADKIKDINSKIVKKPATAVYFSTAPWLRTTVSDNVSASYNTFWVDVPLHETVTFSVSMSGFAVVNLLLTRTNEATVKIQSSSPAFPAKTSTLDTSEPRVLALRGLSFSNETSLVWTEDPWRHGQRAGSSAVLFESTDRILLGLRSNAKPIFDIVPQYGVPNGYALFTDSGFADLNMYHRHFYQNHDILVMYKESVDISDTSAANRKTMYNTNFYKVTF